MMTAAVEVLGRLRTIPDVQVFDSYIPDTPPGAYVMFWDDTPAQYPSRAIGIADRSRWEFQAVCVGRDPNQCRYVVELVQAKLTNWRIPNMNGSWVCPQADSAPTLRSESVSNDIRFSQTLSYAVYTSRSAS